MIKPCLHEVKLSTPSNSYLPSRLKRSDRDTQLPSTVWQPCARRMRCRHAGQGEKISNRLGEIWNRQREGWLSACHSLRPPKSELPSKAQFWSERLKREN